MIFRILNEVDQKTQINQLLIKLSVLQKRHSNCIDYGVNEAQGQAIIFRLKTMKKTILTSVAIAAFSISPSLAADDIQVDESRFDWSGRYWGAQVGWAGADYLSVETPNAVGPYNATGTSGSGDFNGWLAGVHVGSRTQNGNMVYGIEADLGWMDVSGVSSSHNAFDTFGEVNDGLYGTARLTAGFGNENMLIYGTGGFAFFNTDIGVSDTNPVGATINAVESETLTGYAVGGGIEFRTSSDWNWKIEYLHMDFGDTNVSGFVGAIGPLTWSDSLSVDTVSLKLSKPF